MAFQDLIVEIERARLRCESLGIIDTKKEFSDNVYPLIAQFAEEVDARFRETETVVADYLQEQDSFLLPDLSEAILATLQLGIGLCDSLLANAVKYPELQEIAAAFNKLAKETAEEVIEVTVEEEGEEGDEEDEDDEDDTEAEEK